MKKIITILFVSVIFAKSGNGQSANPAGLDVSMRGYLFFTKNGVFFQPFSFPKENGDFIASLNKESFRIENLSHMPVNLEPLKNFGEKVIVANYFHDSISKKQSLRIFDTVSYFRCNIQISMQFFDTSYVSFSPYGYGFNFNNNWVSYGNLSIRNWLYKVEPDDLKVLLKFRNHYVKNGIIPPDWLEDLYKKRVSPKRR